MIVVGGKSIPILGLLSFYQLCETLVYTPLKKNKNVIKI